MARQASKTTASTAKGLRPAKRSFRIAGHATSISLEAAFWDEFTAASERLGLPLAQLVAEIDTARGDTNLSSAVRVWILNDLKQRIASHENAG